MRAIILFFGLFLSLTSYADINGIFVIVKGKVYIEKINNEKVEAKRDSKIFPGETVVTEDDSRAKIIMSDRNIINVLPNTKLKIEIYTNSEKDKNVDLRLIEGRVRTDVREKYDGKKNKFEIKTAIAVAGVRGTEFMMSHDPAAKITEVVTIFGKVSLTQISTVKDNMGFGAKGEVIVSTQQKAEVREGSSGTGKAQPIPQKEFETIKRDSHIMDDKAKTKNGGSEARGGGSNETDSGGGGQNDLNPVSNVPAIGPAPAPVPLPPPAPTPVQIDVH